MWLMMLMAAMPLECRVVVPTRPLGVATSTSGQLVTEILNQRVAAPKWAAWAPRWSAQPEAWVMQSTLPESERDAFEAAVKELWTAPGNDAWEHAGSAFARRDRALRFDAPALAHQILVRQSFSTAGKKQLPRATEAITWCLGDDVPPPAPSWKVVKQNTGARVIVDRPGLSSPVLLGAWALSDVSARDPALLELTHLLQTQLQASLGESISVRQRGSLLVIEATPSPSQAVEQLETLVTFAREGSLKPGPLRDEAAYEVANAAARRDPAAEADRVAQSIAWGASEGRPASISTLKSLWTSIRADSEFSWVVVMSLDEPSLARLSAIAASGSQPTLVVPWL